MEMFKKANKKALKTCARRKTYSFSRLYGVKEGEQDALCAAKSENCDCRGGVLTSGFGTGVCKDEYNNDIVLLNDGIKVKQVGYVRTKTSDGYEKELLLLQENNAVSRYDLRLSEFVGVHTFSANAEMQMLDFVDKDENFVKIFYGKDGVYAYQSGSLSLLYDGEVTAACVTEERLFLGLKPYTVAFSAVGDCSSFSESTDEGGKVFPVSDKGEILEMQAFQNEVYIFLERGIFRLNPKGAAREFTLQEISFCGGQVLKHSVKTVQDKLFFLTKKGAFVFDGKKVAQEYEKMGIFPDVTKNSSSAVFENRYLVNYTDKDGAEKCVSLDLAGDGQTLFSLPVLCDFESQVYTQRGEILHRVDNVGVLPSGERYRYVSQKIADDEKEKTLRLLTLTGEGACTVIVHSDRSKMTIDADMAEGNCLIKPFLKGRAFWLEFLLEKGTNITSVQLETDYVKRG